MRRSDVIGVKLARLTLRLFTSRDYRDRLRYVIARGFAADAGRPNDPDVYEIAAARIKAGAVWTGAVPAQLVVDGLDGEDTDQ